MLAHTDTDTHTHTHTPPTKTTPSLPQAACSMHTQLAHTQDTHGRQLSVRRGLAGRPVHLIFPSAVDVVLIFPSFRSDSFVFLIYDGWFSPHTD